MTLLFALALLAHGNLSTSQQPTQASQGTVQGVVVDSDYKPIKDASVYADNLSQPSPSRPYTVLTDAQGHFVLDAVPPGHIVMRAYKEADKYPKTSSTFDEPVTAGTAPEFELKAGEEFQGIVIRLDGKAGLLHLRVLDAGTKELVKGITFQMCRGDHPGDSRYCISGSARGDYRLFVPALAPISIKISAPNHNDWMYQDPTTKSLYIALAKGEERTLTINLQPSGTR